MHRRFGFTIVELAVVITIIGILLGVGMVGLGRSQMQSRDNERRVDAENIAMAIESSPVSLDGVEPDGYPGLSLVCGMSQQDITTWLPDIPLDSLRSPTHEGEGISFVSRVCNLNTYWPSANNDIYVYVPTGGAAPDNRCTAVSCRGFEIYYYQESDDSVHMHRSRRQ